LALKITSYIPRDKGVDAALELVESVDDWDRLGSHGRESNTD
jgi:hypothetical protein